MSGYLELADGGLIGVRDGLVLGRVAACDIVIDDTKASRRHARVIVESGVVEIEDMGSSNGTLLNGKPVDRRMLRDGDEIKIGKTAIVYREGTIPGRSGGSSSRPAAAAAVFDDDDDLLGGDDLGGDDLGGDDGDLLGGDELAAAPEPPPQRPQPQPRPEPAPPPPPAPAGNVVEFEDEVVEVAKPEPKPARRVDPVVEVRRAEPSRPAGNRNKGGGDGEVAAASGRILQYSKKAGGSNPLGDDLGQMSGTMRLVVVVAVLALGAGVVYGIMIAMQ